ncbi:MULTISPECIES: ComF family protein [Shewanella]|uniref:Amidophosphoribosyltransferase n=1 Tax=Shewanella marisflavi TaxID=260364 RepID=A0AAC9XPY2_9GAMM|nr:MULTISPECIES: ComF family protein [Shewanella]ASJ98334.1 amidophosphoribosyltransferase [Shewanella marisflavi]QDF76912.1 ComF family protein [Shewanella marisflavi]
MDRTHLNLSRWHWLGARLKRLLAASLPNRCMMCHQRVVLPQRGICLTCLHAGLYASPSCLGCGRLISVQTCYCGACMKSLPIKVVAPASYHDGLGEAVAAIKYQGQLAGLTPLVNALVQRIQALVEIEAITLPQVLVPVPLHPKRLRERGFNQAYLIASELGQALSLPVLPHALARICDTQPQAGLTGKQRRRNLAGAFSLMEDFDYQRIALIDDVVTTGTTVSEITKLFERRYIQVQVWCLARAEAPHLND